MYTPIEDCDYYDVLGHVMRSANNSEYELLGKFECWFDSNVYYGDSFVVIASGICDVYGIEVPHETS